ncbi:MAG TPA: glycogen debranching protein GlgX [Planctomycetaceae bacterium]|nr:glycogen debranching protein GlgX [Planctomycetaceae bacterium]
MDTGVRIGRPAPLGATVFEGGVNFSLFSKNATGVELLFFDRIEDACPARVISIDSGVGRTYQYWHVFVADILPGQIYAYRVQGPFAAQCGHRFDADKVLIDPYARSIVVPSGYNRQAATVPGDNVATAMKCAVVDTSLYDWEGDSPLRRADDRTILYEMHVRGFTRSPTSGIAEHLRGTYAGVIEKIPYLQKLGITAVELMPVFQFDALDAPPGRTNYWGYSPVSFFAPHQDYCSRLDSIAVVDEFRDMVKALHRAGIEVILDVVFNHTAEGDAAGPTLSLRGIDNSIYYMLGAERARYENYSGCGNTLNSNQSVVRRMLLDALRYWVQEMHVDGFRFDLASIFSRDSSGRVLAEPPVIWDIETDPVLAGVKLIAEAWDAAGLYQVGQFFGDAWKEWNGLFRDDVRSFFRCDPGSQKRFADRLLGSPSIFERGQREPEQSVNFVTCHDGFTLNDLVSYERKHNEANGDVNCDGTNDNRSWNCGFEGPSSDPAIESVRNRQVKNLLATTVLSVGMPMLSMGDEVRRTQWGNNNAYCQDNATSWFDWALLEKHSDVYRFASLVNARRNIRDEGPHERRMTLGQLLQCAKHAWHGVKLNQPDWSDASHALAHTAETLNGEFLIHVIFNAFWKPLDFELPLLHERNIGPWRRWIDTSLTSPEDISDWPPQATVQELRYCAAAHSVVVLVTTTGP